MAYRYAPSSARSFGNLIEISSDSEAITEGIHSNSDNEPAEREANNRRLTQAINYLQQDGGDDSPRTFMDRVNRISETLVRQLPQQGQTFDRNLYRRVRVLILDAQRDFRDAAARDTPMSDVDDAPAQYYIPMHANEALHREGSSSPSPRPDPSSLPKQRSNDLAPRRPGVVDDVERERVFKYGGPDNVPEMWHRDLPAILPFPETHLMAHWESMKINYDISRPKGESAVETDIPLNHPQLSPHLALQHYESGSRFKMPAVSKTDQDMVNDYGEQKIRGKVASFYCEKDAAKHAPSVFLEKFGMGVQLASKLMNQIRNSLAVSPSKPRAPKPSSESTIPSKRSSPPLIEACIYNTNNVLAAVRPASAPRVQKSKSPTPRLRTPIHNRPSPAFRRIGQEVRHAAGESFPAAPSAPPKRGRGRPPKNRTPVVKITPVPIPVPALTLNTPTTPSISLGKRKPSLGSQPYSAPKSSLKKSLRENKRQKTSTVKSVGFVDSLEEDSSDPNYNAEPVKNLPVRKVARGVKASKAGEEVKKRNETRERVMRLRMGKSVTRSGMEYTLA